jgi:hypothetical protein
MAAAMSSTLINAHAHLLLQRLRLHAAQHRCAAAFPAVGVGHAGRRCIRHRGAVAMMAAQIALRARGHEQRRLFAQQRRNTLLQRIHRGVVAKDVVAQLRPPSWPARMAAVGWVTVSLRRSTIFMA